MPSVTLTRVAADAGVSVATASRALSGRGDLSPATRRHVLAVATSLGYRRTTERGGRPPAFSRLFDLVLHAFHSPYYDEVTAGARGAAADAGYDLVLTEERDDAADDWPARIRRRGSAGVVLGLITPTAAQLAPLHAAGIPLVVVDPRAELSADLAHVQTTDRQGGIDAARHLAARGAARFAVLSGTPAFRYGRARRAGFVDELAERMPWCRVDTCAGEWSARSARDAVTPILRELDPGERLGVFAVSDEMAAGVYLAAAALGLRIPDDLLVVGFDDVPAARWLSPPLTTVRQPIREMAAAGVRVLADAAAGGPDPVGPVTLPTQLIVRGST